MFPWSGMSLEAWPFEVNENEELRKVSSAKERMLEEVVESRSFMKRINNIGEMTEPWDTPALIEYSLERKPSTLTTIHL